ncbi:hypothetical protein GRI62_00375 [Erythrobacter arachoides]|uniref:ABC transporter substrate-binding protein n=1 Tax=Aurantiacibacter arachoides TaxID=1850444 RepID=A0A844ZXY2_9SPHN|nr:hypothetical protein [Aurantiacibacter arachoides]MXO92060.1 hypothetical protein [Aurantiacibacter arachoides]GGD60078.1 hypothetical protein GCM10011411_20300 [Aurantiacibacter arachoides]
MAISTLMVSCAIVAGCGIPLDPGGTTDRVRDDRIIRLGEIAGADPDASVRAALVRVAEATDARIERTPGHAEELLEALEAGRLDLVYGRFAGDSPWATHVHFGKQPGRADAPGKSERVPRFAYRNGENGWITLVEHEVSR